MLKLYRNLNKCANLKKCNFSTLVLAEHFEGKLNANLGNVITAAKQMDD